ncbi:hypothetical protein [Abyssisolibacter fermentans]|uniref:hypothetical protein n=1 Tax=Abyssisolibacter fermentans TaxID=1766203 RepID=UPI000830AC4C|nr:hypothetical protein [Abyssisolibacter fermentans]
MKNTIKYIILILSLAFFSFSIYYVTKTASNIEYDIANITYGESSQEEKVKLDVNEKTKMYFLHNIKIGLGKVVFVLEKEDGKIIEKYEVDDKKFTNKVFELEKGTYYYKFIRNARSGSENYRILYNKSKIISEICK